MATKPIIIQISGDDSGLKASLKSASDGVSGFAKKIGKLGLKAGLAFTGLAGAIGVSRRRFRSRRRHSWLPLLPNLVRFRRDENE